MSRPITWRFRAPVISFLALTVILSATAQGQLEPLPPKWTDSRSAPMQGATNDPAFPASAAESVGQAYGASGQDWARRDLADSNAKSRNPAGPDLGDRSLGGDANNRSQDIRDFGDRTLNGGDVASQTQLAAECESCESCCDRTWDWQFLPSSIIYPAYLAGAKESRFAGFWAYDKNEGWIWDIALGGRVGLWRYGTRGDNQPEGWQFDMEGAAFPRLDLENNEDLMSTDYRFGAPLTYAHGRYQAKLAFYHLSSHVGDEFMLRNPSFTRINYSRNALVLGQAYFAAPDTRLYAEAEYAVAPDVGEPWAFQFGVDYSPVRWANKVSAPFAAVNGHLREEVDFGGNFVAQAGWQWRPQGKGRSLRAGLEYYVGKSDQFEFYDQNETKWGVGLWYDY